MGNMLDTQQLRVKNLSYQVNQQILLNNISCIFSAGQIHAVLGQNGAGKSTLLNCLTKLFTPTSGEIIWLGTPLADYSFAELALQRGVLSQSVELAFTFSVQQLVMLGAEVQQNYLAQAVIVKDVLQACDMWVLRDRAYLTLSGGEQQRTQLARVLAQIWPPGLGGLGFSAQNSIQPIFLGKWLFLDEWVASLDIQHQQKLARCFKQWSQLGLSIVMVLHDVAFAAQLADSCLILKAGEVYASGATKNVLTETNLQQALGMTARVEKNVTGNRLIISPWVDGF